MSTAIITGASRGFGRALAAALAADGWTVVVDARSASELDEAAAAIGGSVVPIAGDVTDAAHRAALIDAAVRTGRLDLVVNNASTLGPLPMPRLADLDGDGFLDAFRVNVAAPLALVQAALPHLRESGGALVNITSDAAVEGYEGWGAYGATKAALEQASNVLAAEEPDVRVWWFDPGDMRTRMHQDAFPGEDISDRPEPEAVVPALLHLVSERLPSGRFRSADLLEAAAR